MIDLLFKINLPKLILLVNISVISLIIFSIFGLVYNLTTLLYKLSLWGGDGDD